MPPVTSCLGCGADIPIGTSRCEACRPRKATIPGYRAFRALRPQVLAGAVVCSICGGPGTPDNPLNSVDHGLARARGGTHDRANLAAAHGPCNSAKGAGAPKVPGIRVL